MINFNSTDNYIDIHFPSSEKNTFNFGNGKNILLLGNLGGFFGVVEDRSYCLELTDSRVVNNSYLRLDTYCSDSNNKLIIVSDKDTLSYYKAVLRSIADAYGKKIKYQCVDIDDFIVKTKLKIASEKRNEVYINILNKFKDMNMQFDYILMNPPYDGNLHLKIVEEAIKFLKDDNSICVNLSPVRWLQDPLAKYKKGSDYNRFETLRFSIWGRQVIKALESQQMFGNTMNIDLCIYVFKKCKSPVSLSFIEPLVEKIVSFNQVHNPVFDSNKKDGWRVRIPIITVGKSGGQGKRAGFKQITLGNLFAFYEGKKDGKYWYDYYAKNQYSKTTEEITNSIKFDTEQQCINFIKQFDLVSVKWYMLHVFQDVHVAPEQILWLGDVENPRTHKIGYESDWTNEDLCKVFGITGYISDTEAEPGSEWETILETMKPYLD